MTVRSLSILALVAGDMYVTSAQQESVSPIRRQFVACPIVRDTKTQPCWLAEYEGELYYLGQQSGVANDFYPPQLGHLALVEAVGAEVHLGHSALAQRADELEAPAQRA